MGYLKFKDISYAQGAYNMAANKDPIVVMKASGFYTGAKTPYLDTQLKRNYTNAVKAKKAIGLYHFAGGADPTTEANYFIRAVQPYAENDVYILDWEIEHSDPVGWVNTFMNRVHAVTGVWPWLYIDIDRLNRFNWSPVLKNCGLWCAAPSFSFTAKLPIKYPVIAQQGPIVNGVDTDAFFGTLTQFKKYGYHKPAAKPAPVKETPSAPTKPVTTTPPKPSKPSVTPPKAPVQPTKPVQPAPVQPPVEVKPAPTAPAQAPAPSKINTAPPVASPPHTTPSLAQETLLTKLWQLFVAIIKKLFGAKG